MHQSQCSPKSPNLSLGPLQSVPTARGSCCPGELLLLLATKWRHPGQQLVPMHSHDELSEVWPIRVPEQCGRGCSTHARQFAPYSERRSTVEGVTLPACAPTATELAFARTKRRKDHAAARCASARLHACLRSCIIGECPVLPWLFVLTCWHLLRPLRPGPTALPTLDGLGLSNGLRSSKADTRTVEHIRQRRAPALHSWWQHWRWCMPCAAPARACWCWQAFQRRQTALVRSECPPQQTKRASSIRMHMWGATLPISPKRLPAHVFHANASNPAAAEAAACFLFSTATRCRHHALYGSHCWRQDYALPPRGSVCSCMPGHLRDPRGASGTGWTSPAPVVCRSIDLRTRGLLGISASHSP